MRSAIHRNKSAWPCNDVAAPSSPAGWWLAFLAPHSTRVYYANLTTSSLPMLSAWTPLPSPNKSLGASFNKLHNLPSYLFGLMRRVSHIFWKIRFLVKFVNCTISFFVVDLRFHVFLKFSERFRQILFIRFSLLNIGLLKTCEVWNHNRIVLEIQKRIS